MGWQFGPPLRCWCNGVLVFATQRTQQNADLDQTRCTMIGTKNPKVPRSFRTPVGCFERSLIAMAYFRFLHRTRTFFMESDACLVPQPNMPKDL